VEAAIGRRVGRKRCRFLVGGHLGRIRSCARPVYRTIPSAQAWDSRARHLRRGVYEVRFRTTDVRGNRTRRPKLHVVHVRA
jgi:hypothetical protein